MRFGLHYLPTYLPPLDGSVPDLYARIFAQIEAADTLGFTDAWITEHHFNPYGGTIPDPALFLAALARTTRRIRLGVAVSVVPLHNALQVAETYAMVDVISGGRLEFGVGRGSTILEFERFQKDKEDTALHLREATEIILRAWSEEAVTFRGALYQYADVPVLPKPLQRPHPPIWVGATRTPETFQWAGQRGFHLMVLPYMFDPAELQHRLGLYRDALVEAGHDPSTRHIEGKFHVYVAESKAAAAREATPYLENYRKVAEARDPGRVRPSTGPYDYDAQVGRGNIICGDAQQCIDVIYRWRETLGLTAVSGTFHFGGMPHELALKSIRLFAEKVIPAFPSADGGGS